MLSASLLIMRVCLLLHSQSGVLIMWKAKFTITPSPSCLSKATRLDLLEYTLWSLTKKKYKISKGFLYVFLTLTKIATHALLLSCCIEATCIPWLLQNAQCTIRQPFCLHLLKISSCVGMTINKTSNGLQNLTAIPMLCTYRHLCFIITHTKSRFLCSHN